MLSYRECRHLSQLTLVLLLCTFMPRPAVAQESSISERMGVRHLSGQGVSPVYEGFDVNPDGTYNLWFGYMNRNYEEELDIAPGPDNVFEPGGDRGQPTHFASRRHKDVFKVVVPKDFGEQKLVWKLTAHGRTESIAATLNRVWQIDRRKTTRGGNDDAVDSNTPPTVTVEPSTQVVRTGDRATVTVTAVDDGLPKRRRPLIQVMSVPGIPVLPPPPGQRAGGPGGPGAGQQGPGLSFEWFKYRGPGKVVFDPPLGMFVAGKVSATATFSEPGAYVLQVVVDDGSGESAGNFGYHCCWTAGEVKVTVQDAAK
jgi:hypothetical protein